MLYTPSIYMQRIAVVLMLSASSAFAVPQPYPIGVDSQTRSVPALEMYQAEPFTVRATFRSGGVAEDISTVTPFMYWATSAGATNYVTSSWSRVNGGTTGVVDFTFSAAALNTNGDLIYGVGAGSTFRQGALKIRANPFASGVASPTFTLATNLAGISFINYPWLDSVSLYQGNSNHAAVSGNGLVIVVRTNYGGGSITSESDPIFVAASNALLTKAQASSLYATGTPVYTESDPLFVAASNALLTKVQAASLYATGTPLYTVSGIGTDTTARAWALGASNRADAAYVLAANAATGTPIYSVAGLATGTPIYSVAGLATGTPIYSVAGLATGTPIYSVDGLATGTPLYVESFTGSVGSLSGYMPSAAVTTAINALSFPLASGESVSQRVAAVESAGYAVNGQNITGRWFAVGNTNSGDESFIGGGAGNATDFDRAVVVGGTRNRASGENASIVGGVDNYAPGQKSFIGGGDNNKAYGLGSVVIGGGNNLSSGTYSVAVGGSCNAIGDFSFAAGLTARATHDGSFVWSGPGTTNATFESRGGNTFNVRSVGGVYFLAPDFWIQDTNGNTIARFSATNTTISGNLNLTGYATTSDVLTVGIRATNAQITASNAASTASAATNLAIGIGAGATNGLNAIGLVATNGQITASNALAAALGVGVVVSNQTPSAWSQIATNHANMSNYAITNVDYIAFGTNTIDGTETNAIGIYNGHPSWVTAPGSVRTLASSDNLSSLGIQTTSGFNSSITNYARITPTGYSFPSAWNDSVGINGDLVRDGTNMAFKSAGVWVRWTVVTNW